MSLKLGLAGPLPPAGAGPADYIAGLLPALSGLAELICFVPDPAEVDPALAARYSVRALSERRDSDVDLIVYHLANNPWHLEVVRAAMDGPPGIAVVHDASLHHLLSAQLLDTGHEDAYRELLVRAHGSDGAAIADLRAAGIKGEVELFVFDMLRPALERQLAAIAHSAFGAQLVRDRVPGLPVHVIPHYLVAASEEPAPVEPSWPAGRFVIGHLGYVTPAKRPELLLEAFVQLLAAGIDAQLVFAGEDQTWGPLNHHIDRLGVRDRVTVTGFLTETELDAYAAASDAVVSLRWPHVGETSGTLMRALRVGRPVVVQALGAWAELPRDAVVRVPASGDEASSLADALIRVASDEAFRSRVERGARAYAAEVGDAERSAAHQLRVIEDTLRAGRMTPRQTTDERAAAVRGFLEAGPAHLADALTATGSTLAHQLVDEHLRRYHATLGVLPPAAPGAKLLDVGSAPPVLRVLASVWGYDVRACGHAVSGEHRVDMPASAGLPAFTAVYDGVDVELDRFPYETGRFDVVTCWEVLEHLGRDPMHMLHEVNRVLAPEGVLVLTTPNVVSLRSVRAVLEGYHPFLWSEFWRSAVPDRHNREYTPREIRMLLEGAGFSSDGVRTIEVWGSDDPEVRSLLSGWGGPQDRGDCIVAVARKVGLPSERYPEELYR
jgi:glycosyltransferase involved in cell wall biosynthesis/2-polyprenyl-3-methyl-5-hydroxy-6-metoxy-1,4-benzoquinol methylase